MTDQLQGLSGMSDVDLELRTNIRLLNEMFDRIIQNANIPTPEVPSVDLTTSPDFPAIGEAVMRRLSAIELKAN
jgi:hypothetical protein